MSPRRTLIAASLAGAALLAGCSTTPTTPAAASATEPAPKAAAPVAPATPATPAAPAAPTARSTDAPAASAAQRSATPLHRDPASGLDQRSVYFDFDQFVIRPEFVQLLRKHADYLGKEKSLKVQIQGNADERGSREYNLALGQKRAEAVQRALKANGVDGDRIETISFGEEKPKAKGSDEASWAENRRADILYSGEY